MRMDGRLSELDRQIAGLQQQRAAREAQLADPKRAEILAEYEKIDQALNRLNDLGEEVEDVEGNAVHIRGRTFEVMIGGGVAEV